MIVKKLMITCTCDNCGEKWKDSNGSSLGHTTSEGLEKAMKGSDWLRYHGKDYCPTCWSKNHLTGSVILRHVDRELCL